MKIIRGGMLLLCALWPVAVSGEPSNHDTVISPDSPLPCVVAAEGVFVDPYHGGGNVHQDAAADLCHYLGRVTGRDIQPSGQPAEAMVTIHVGPDDFVLEHAPEVKDLFGWIRYKACQRSWAPPHYSFRHTLVRIALGG